MQDKTQSKPDQTLLGICFIVASVFAMAFSDAVVKLVSKDMTVWQVFFARAIIAIPLLTVIIIATKTGFKLQSLWWTSLRSFLLVCTWLVFYGSFPFLSLSVAATAIYTTPIVIALLSAAITGEGVSHRQWFGVFCGFLGVVAILRPGTDAFSWYVILPLSGAFFYAFAMIITRTKCQDEKPLVLTLSLQLQFMIFGLLATLVMSTGVFGVENKQAFPFIFGDWAEMSMREWAWMALIGTLSAAYFMGVSRAYQIAPPSTVAVFDYVYLVWAAMWGYVFFAETPDFYTILGMCMITLAGIFVAKK